MIFLVLGVSVLATAAYFAAEAATHPARQRALSIRRAATYGKVRLASRAGQESFSERVVGPATMKLASLALRLTPRATVESTSAKLRAAGLSRTISPSAFLAGKSALALAGLFAGLTFGTTLGGAGVGILFAVGGAAVCFLAPDFLLNARARSRKERVRAELPDALDLLAVSVEAGLGFDGAISKLTEHMEGPLVDELTLSLNQMRIGESRADALRGFAERVDVPEVVAFVRAIIQADQLGMSLGRILRVQAADSRLRRQAAAEERAMKAPIKMLFPTVLFIFPAMFLVILGPAFLHLLEMF
ncbi:MAG TPA: type II secretion system F family protein [Gaiellaceae bacterium]|jgi:tight adherence protein C|nr:type II secretion system F family protein [Gaiellaceae bacterium]